MCLLTDGMWADFFFIHLHVCVCVYQLNVYMYDETFLVSVDCQPILLCNNKTLFIILVHHHPSRYFICMFMYMNKVSYMYM